MSWTCESKEGSGSSRPDLSHDRRLGQSATACQRCPRQHVLLPQIPSLCRDYTINGAPTSSPRKPKASSFYMLQTLCNASCGNNNTGLFPLTLCLYLYHKLEPFRTGELAHVKRLCAETMWPFTLLHDIIGLLMTQSTEAWGSSTPKK